MAKIYDKPITIQKINETTELYEDLFDLHASVNKASADNETATAGAIRAKRSLSFDVRYFSALSALSLNPQKYRVVYEDHQYNLTGYDDYMEQHKSVRLFGVLY